MGLHASLFARIDKGEEGEEVAYWYKANQVHRWFIENCADKEADDCEPIVVTIEQLMELRNIAFELIAKDDENSEKAMRLLPPCEGEFFGSSKIDEGYWLDIEDTLNMLDVVINDHDVTPMEYVYRASW